MGSRRLAPGACCLHHTAAQSRAIVEASFIEGDTLVSFLSRCALGVVVLAAGASWRLAISCESSALTCVFQETLLWLPMM